MPIKAAMAMMGQLRIQPMLPDTELDGTAAWVDGGPRGDLAPDDVGGALVHAESVEAAAEPYLSDDPVAALRAALALHALIARAGCTSTSAVARI